MDCAISAATSRADMPVFRCPPRIQRRILGGDAAAARSRACIVDVLVGSAFARAIDQGSNITEDIVTTQGVVFVLVFVAGIAALCVHDALLAWRRWRDVRLVTCPETSRAAAVTVDATHAARTAFFESAPELRLSTCSRWATRGPCRQPCLHALTHAGRAATVDAVMTTWYSGHACMLCGRQVGRVKSRARPPALIGPDGVTVEWRSLPPEQLVDLFDTHGAVCWDCHLAESFRRLNPGLYVDRPASAARRY